MCLHPRNDTLDKSVVNTFNCTLIDNCDYLPVDDCILLNSNDIVVLQLNIRGLQGKIDRLKWLINENFKGKEPDILLLCETWMSANSPDICLPNYKKFEVRRQHKKGGGVCIFVNKRLTFRPRPDLHINNTNFEHCVVEINLKKHNLLVGSVYRAPNCNQQDFLTAYTEFVSGLKEKRNCKIILGMDHNLDLLKSHLHSNTQEFININYDCDLFPVITKPTRITHTSATLIDNIFLDALLIGNMTNRILVDDISDHLPTVTILEGLDHSPQKKVHITSRDTRQKQLKALKTDLTDRLTSLDLQGNVDKQFEMFHDIILDSLNKHCPIRNRQVSSAKIRREPWLTSGLIISINKQRKLYQHSVRFDAKETDIIKYKNYRNLLTKLKRTTKIMYYQSKCHEYKNNIKKLWNLVNSCIGKTNDKSTIIDHLKIDNLEIHDSKQIANEFGHYFSKIGKTYADKIKPSKTNISDYLKVIPRNVKSLYLTPTTNSEIIRLINKLPNKKSTGYDGIDNVILKHIKECISPTIATLFNLSMLEGKFPDMMKLAEVVPLYKSKEMHLLNNYRPISLLITISKLLEKIMYARTYSFLQTTGQLFESQYGFRKGHSCEYAISELISVILKNKEANRYTISLFLDLSKAFDSLKHNTLLKKLELYGVRGVALNWYSSYLNSRELRAKCMTSSGDFEVSQKYPVTYGTPQGSCLGPLLFLLFCNDLRLHLTYLSCIQFADDTTLYTSGKNIRLLECEINHDLEIISDWFKANKLTLNADKTACMIFPPNKNSVNSIRVKILDQAIPICTQTKFLGLWLDRNLCWDKHLSVTCSKMKQNLGLMRKCKNHLDNRVLRIMYYAHIHSHLSYSILVWGSTTKGSNLKKLQKIQNACIKTMQPNMKLTEGFRNLKILTVHELVDLELCKFFFKLMNGMLPPKLTDCMLKDSRGLTLRKCHDYMTRHKSLPNLPRANDTQYKNSFLTRSNKLYTSIPDHIKNVKRLSEFVKNLKILVHNDG